MGSSLFKGLTGIKPRSMLMSGCECPFEGIFSEPEDEARPEPGFHTGTWLHICEVYECGVNSYTGFNRKDNDCEGVATTNNSPPDPPNLPPIFINRAVSDQGLIKVLAFLLNIAEGQLLAPQGPPALLVRAVQLGVGVSRFLRPGVSLNVDPEEKDDDWVDLGRAEDGESDDEVFD
ncbi:hypothetical protein BDV93DRAFT_612137 [Ceratobasidium sp. AG-I]|nr:hypothetical protein BDV93DRAFT_612137 [Ceratobasidium sp. AG-I]